MNETRLHQLEEENGRLKKIATKIGKASGNAGPPTDRSSFRKPRCLVGEIRVGAWQWTPRGPRGLTFQDWLELMDLAGRLEA